MWVHGENGDKDGNAGALRASECPQHRVDAGGRNIPPPTVRQVRYEGPPEGAKWASPGDRAVYERSGEEETAAGRYGDKRELVAGFRSIWITHRFGVGDQIPGEDTDGNIRRLAGGGWKPPEGKTKLGTAGQGAYQGGRRPEGVTGVIHRRDTGCFDLRV